LLQNRIELKGKFTGMKANELRIGNLVFNHLNTIQKITASNIVAQSQFDIAKAKGYSPIPLTEELLFNCGFELNDKCYEICSQNGIVIEIRFISDCYYLVTQCEWGYNGFLYLHQFQNLYFSLTGQELNTSNLTDL